MTRIEQCEYNGRPHFRVQGSLGAWWYDIPGGGFSGLMDPEGKDWIRHRREMPEVFPAGAAAGYRGLGNLVYGGTHGGAGHPGHDMCRSEADENCLRSETLDGTWRWSWVFEDDQATFTMDAAPPEATWWFLYEGTVEGGFDPREEIAWLDGEPITEQRPGIGDQRFGPWTQVSFGRKGGVRRLGLEVSGPAPVQSSLWWMGNEAKGDWTQSRDGMVVWGFGRGPGAKPLLQGSGWSVKVFWLDFPRDDGG